MVPALERPLGETVDSGADPKPGWVYAAPNIMTRRPSECDRPGALKGLAAQPGAAGVPFKDLEAATRSRINYRALTDGLNALVNEGAVRCVTEKPARLAITDAGRSGSTSIDPNCASV